MLNSEKTLIGKKWVSILSIVENIDRIMTSENYVLT